MTLTPDSRVTDVPRGAGALRLVISDAALRVASARVGQRAGVDAQPVLASPVR